MPARWSVTLRASGANRLRNLAPRATRATFSSRYRRLATSANSDCGGGAGGHGVFFRGTRGVRRDLQLPSGGCLINHHDPTLRRLLLGRVRTCRDAGNGTELLAELVSTHSATLAQQAQFCRRLPYRLAMGPILVRLAELAALPRLVRGLFGHGEMVGPDRPGRWPVVCSHSIRDSPCALETNTMVSGREIDAYVARISSGSQSRWLDPERLSSRASSHSQKSSAP
jgi:hypothetical protein